MKLAISAMSHEKEAVQGLELHSPLVRSRLVGLLGYDGWVAVDPQSAEAPRMKPRTGVCGSHEETAR